MSEMAGGGVDANVEAGRCRKIANLTHRLVNDVTCEGDNQVVLFGERNKNVRGDPSLTGVVPAQQDLHPHAFLRAGIQQRLAKQLEFTRGQAKVNFPGKAHAVRGRKPGDVTHQETEHQRQRQLRGQIYQRQLAGSRATDGNGEREMAGLLAQNPLIIVYRQRVGDIFTVAQVFIPHGQRHIGDKRALWLQHQASDEIDIHNLHHTIFSAIRNRIPLDQDRASLKQGFVGGEHQLCFGGRQGRLNLSQRDVAIAENT